ncbi:hypothetical protein DPMN_129351 [Dreissena polymorpha]|uniref:Uncharacterized protein n=1 Tax=Dreissena polymorpha TaxID=45954 RepID=A0A9D4H5L9_DREPO|nr:hypothetical protein DPMN_129351 [Dreissena polymorpha]
MDSRVSMQTAGDSTHVHASDIDIVTVITLTVRELPMRPRSADDSLFRKSRPSCKPDPVQLVSYRRKSLSS